MLKILNLFRLPGNKTMKMLSMRARIKSKDAFVATKICETVASKKILKSLNSK